MSRPSSLHLQFFAVPVVGETISHSPVNTRNNKQHRSSTLEQIGIMVTQNDFLNLFYLEDLPSDLYRSVFLFRLFYFLRRR